jgi:hypothetical protein
MRIGNRIAIQFLTSLIALLFSLFALVQPDVNLAVQYTLLLSFQNFTQLLLRRISYEGYLHKTNLKKRPPLYEIGFLFFAISAFYSILNSWSLLPTILVSVYAFLMAALDFLNFENSQKSGLFILYLLIFSIVTLVIVYQIENSIFFSFLGINLVLSIGLVSQKYHLFRREFAFNRSVDIDWIRGADYFLTSGYAFFLPFLVFYLTSSFGLIELRLSQMVLSLANLMVMAFYLNELSSKISLPSRTFVFFPALFISSLAFIIYTFFDSRIPVIDLYLTQNSILLILLLAVSLIFVQFSILNNLKLVKCNKQILVLKRHILTFPFNVVLYFLCVKYLGVVGFGIASIISFVFEFLSMRQLVQQYEQ